MLHGLLFYIITLQHDNFAQRCSSAIILELKNQWLFVLTLSSTSAVTASSIISGICKYLFLGSGMTSTVIYVSIATGKNN